MTWAKRIGLFLMVNFLVIMTISIILSIFNIQPYLKGYGIDYGTLMIFCLIWGMGGALISLAMSKSMAKWMMGVQIIDPSTNDPRLRGLLDMVHGLARQAGLPGMPEVGIYRSPEVNAFATGPSKRNSLVAVSSGMLDRMNREQVEGVLGHEVSHIANGDMVTMTLIQGIVNAFVMFLARALAFVVVRAMSRDREGARVSPFMYYMVVMVLQVFFMILGSIVVAWFSRFREYRADAGSAHVAGREKMISALEALKQTHSIRDTEKQQEAFQALKISDGTMVLRLFATHPPLDARIKRLKEAVI